MYQIAERINSGASTISNADDFISSDHVKVVVRCRPLNHSKEEDSSSILHVNSTNNTVEVKVAPSTTKVYRFSCVTDHTKDQEFLFRQTGKPIVECALDGFNATIITYGQTGSGKTYTMQGITTSSMCAASSPHLQRENNESKGIIQKVCEDIFSHMNESKENMQRGGKITVEASYLEIYNETLVDLLSSETFHHKPIKSGSYQNKLAIREDTNGAITVTGLTHLEVKSPNRCYELLRIGAERRKVATTHMNMESSRSHAVFTLSLSRRDESSGVVRASRLHLVDLAGSERQKATGTTGARLREAGGINKSLSALGNVINSISSISSSTTIGRNQNRRAATINGRIPSCRESKLTFLLKDALGGNSKLCVIATISPALQSIDETISTLEFAQRCTALKNLAVVNEMLSTNVAQLQNEVRRLQQSLRSAHVSLSHSKAGTAELSRRADVFSNRFNISAPGTGSLSPVKCSTNRPLKVDVGIQTDKGEIEILDMKVREMEVLNNSLCEKVMKLEEKNQKKSYTSCFAPLVLRKDESKEGVHEKDSETNKKEEEEDDDDHDDDHDVALVYADVEEEEDDDHDHVKLIHAGVEDVDETTVEDKDQIMYWLSKLPVSPITFSEKSSPRSQCHSHSPTQSTESSDITSTSNVSSGNKDASILNIPIMLDNQEINLKSTSNNEEEKEIDETNNKSKNTVSRSVSLLPSANSKNAKCPTVKAIGIGTKSRLTKYESGRNDMVWKGLKSGIRLKSTTTKTSPTNLREHYIIGHSNSQIPTFRRQQERQSSNNNNTRDNFISDDSWIQRRGISRSSSQQQILQKGRVDRRVDSGSIVRSVSGRHSIGGSASWVKRKKVNVNV